MSKVASAASAPLVTIWIEADTQDYQKVKFDSRRDDQPNKPSLHVASPATGATFEVVVDISMTIAGTVDAFDETAFKATTSPLTKRVPKPGEVPDAIRQHYDELGGLRDADIQIVFATLTLADKLRRALQLRKGV